MSEKLGKELTVFWGGGAISVSLRLSEKDWSRIKLGKRMDRKGRGYRYEGERFQDHWYFNFERPGSLRVTYDGDGDGFVGSIDDAS
jgi:hypothetical protein